MALGAPGCVKYLLKPTTRYSLADVHVDIAFFNITQMSPKSLIDLSHPLTSQTTIYPGDPPFVMHSVCNIPTDGYTVHALSLGTHTGTHVDAPFHFFAQGQKLHELPLERFVGRALVVDVRHLARARGRIEWRDVREGFDRDSTSAGAGSRGDGTYGGASGDILITPILGERLRRNFWRWGCALWVLIR